MSIIQSTKNPEATQQRILEAAFLEFYKNGFQGGSLNHIVEAAGTTKGALFHHFDGKQQLGYSVVDQVIGPIMQQRWLAPLEDTTDPVSALQLAFRTHSKDDLDSGNWLLGCPLNNLAQEMSPLDEGFHHRINDLYERWRGRIAAALRRGIEAGTVRKEVGPVKAAALIVSAQMGIWGSGKSSQRKEVMSEAVDAVCDYLESLRI
ncbi:MAG TPA: TetR/AcrR family transcriptional regulator [Chloroflexota bacterium]|nr:TetR/AcrR family transcriptional regulator [Chloroflexota bacterium]